MYLAEEMNKGFVAMRLLGAELLPLEHTITTAT
jgi:hypothetical protein